MTPTERVPVSSRQTKSRAFLRSALVLLVYLIIFTALDAVSRLLQVYPGVVAWYPPDGLSFALLLAVGPLALPALVIASLLSSLFVFQFNLPFLTLLGWGVLIALAYGLAAWFLRRRLRIDLRLRSTGDLVWLTVSAAVVSTLLAFVSISSAASSGAVPQVDRLGATFQWWIGEMIGVMVVTPALLIHVLPYVKRFLAGETVRIKIAMPATRPPARLTLQVFASLAAIYLAVDVNWPQNFHPFFLIAIPLVWIAIQDGLPGASAANLLVNFGITIGAVAHHTFNLSELGHLQSMMLAISISSLVIGILVSENRRSGSAQAPELEKRTTKILYELILMAVLAMSVWILQFSFDFFGTVTRLEASGQIEGLDELLVILLVLGPASAVFSYRRWKEIQVEILARERAQAELRTLLGDLERRVQERTLDLSKANTLLQAEIVERQVAESARLESETRFRSLFATSPDAILLIDPHNEGVSWPIVDCNEAACRMNGYTREQLIGQSVDVLNLTVGTEEERAAYLGRLRSEGVIHIETFHRHRAGHLFPVEVSTSIFAFEGRELVLGIDRDITERRQAVEALEQSERRFRALVENSLEEVSLINADGTLIFESPSTRRPLGYSTGAFLGKNLLELFHPDDRGVAMAVLNQVIEQPGSHREAVFRLRHEDGSWRWMEGVVSNLLNEPAVGAVVVNYRDVTERKRAELALSESDKRYRSLFEDSPVSIWEEDFSKVKDHLNSHKDEVGKDIEKYLADHPQFVSECARLVKVLDLNQASMILHGAPDKTALLENLAKTFAPDSFDAFRKELVAVWRGEFNLQMDGAVQTLAGQRREVTIIWGVVPGYEHDYSRVLVSLIDITERKHAEEEIHSRTDELATLYALSRALADADDLDQVLAVVNREAVESVRTTFARIAIVEGEELVIRSAYPIRGLDRDLLAGGRQPLAAMPLSRRLLEQDEPMILRAGSMELNAEERAALLLDFAQTVCLVPLRVHDFAENSVRILGLMMVGEARKEEREPFTPEKIRLARSIGDQAAVAIDKARLFNDLERSNIDLGRAYDATIAGWSAALDLRDKETEGHTQRVTEMTLRLAERMGMGAAELVHVRRGALLHDIGKMGVPDSILLKPDTLTDKEWDVMRLHPVYAYQMLEPIAYLAQSLDIPYCHHEKWDGSGYPRHLSGAAIPFAARIFAIVDVYDALTSDRPYRKGWPKKKTIEHIRAQSETHFDPNVVEAFLEMLGKN